MNRARPQKTASVQLVKSEAIQGYARTSVDLLLFELNSSHRSCRGAYTPGQPARVRLLRIEALVDKQNQFGGGK